MTQTVKPVQNWGVNLGTLSVVQSGVGTVSSDSPPQILSTPTPQNFLLGTAGQSYDMSQHILDDGKSAVLYGLQWVTPTGFTFNVSTGELFYDGTGSVDTTPAQLTATDAIGSVTSSAFNVVVVVNTGSQVVTTFSLVEA